MTTGIASPLTSAPIVDPGCAGPARAPSPGGFQARSFSEWLTSFRFLVIAVLAAQLATMLVVSLVEYRRYALGVGFGTYAQAWSAIAHGHLDPVSSLIGKPFWRNDAEFVLWPLSLLYYLYPHPVDLLWVQDLVLVVTEFVAVSWMLEAVAAHPELRVPDSRRLAGLGLVVVIANPFLYYAAAYDFHSEVLAALPVLLIARTLWRGGHKLLWLWVPASLVTSGFGALYAAAVGFSGVIAGPRSRRPALMVCAVAIIWLIFVSLVGGNEFGYAHSLGEWYGYLVGSHHGQVTPFDVVGGTLFHPVTVLRMLAARWVLVLDLLLSAGLVGLGTPWGWPLAAVVLVPSALNANVAFLNPHAAFQNWPALPLLALASFVFIARRLALGGRCRRTGVVAAGVWALSLLVLGEALLPRLASFWVSVDSAAAGALVQAEARIPPGSELIVSSGVVGRFAIHDHVRVFSSLSTSIPVDRRVVVFVFAGGQGTYGVSPSVANRAAVLVRDKLGGRVVIRRGGVEVLVWHPPDGTTRVDLGAARNAMAVTGRSTPSVPSRSVS
jgi:hypothetical protein